MSNVEVGNALHPHPTGMIECAALFDCGLALQVERRLQLRAISSRARARAYGDSPSSYMRALLVGHDEDRCPVPHLASRRIEIWLAGNLWYFPPVKVLANHLE
jgi:hypothetical protein